MKFPKYKILFILSLASLSLLALFFIPPIPQDPAYHNFADKRIILGIPNFWNVFSNLPFLFVGVYGLFVLHKKFTGLSITRFSLVISSGIVLISFGSGYYHHRPENFTLVWDRIPMSAVFMGFLSFLVADRVHKKAGEILLIPLLITGMGSVLYWYAG